MGAPATSSSSRPAPRGLRAPAASIRAAAEAAVAAQAVFAPLSLGAQPARGPRLHALPLLLAVADWTAPTAACRGAGTSRRARGASSPPPLSSWRWPRRAARPAPPPLPLRPPVTFAAAGGRVVSSEAGGAAVAALTASGRPEPLAVCVDVRRRLYVSGRTGACLLPAAAPGADSLLLPTLAGLADPSAEPLALVYRRPVVVAAAHGQRAGRRRRRRWSSGPPLCQRERRVPRGGGEPRAGGGAGAGGALARLVRCALAPGAAGFVALGLASDGAAQAALAQLELLPAPGAWEAVPARVPSNGAVLLLVRGGDVLPAGGALACTVDGLASPAARWLSTAAAACEAPAAASGAARLRLLDPVSAWSLDVSAAAETGGTRVHVGGAGFDGGDSGVGCAFGRVFVRIALVDRSTAECLSPALPARASIVRMSVPELNLAALASYAWDGARCNASLVPGAELAALQANATACGPQYATREVALLRAVDLGDGVGPRVKARAIPLRIALAGSDLTAALDVADIAWARLLSAAAAFANQLAASNGTAPGARRLSSLDGAAANASLTPDDVLLALQQAAALSGPSVHVRRKLLNSTCPPENCPVTVRSLLNIAAVGFNASYLNYTAPDLPDSPYGLRFSLDIDVQPVPFIAALSPNASFVKGYTPVTVRGANFLPTATLGCLFGTTLVPAVYVNSSAVVCHAPPQASYGVVPSPNNGRDFESGLQGAALFTYLACPAGSFCRAGEAFPCPPGHFCPMRVDGNRTWTDVQEAGANLDPFPDVVFTLVQCPPGTYQDEAGQAFCKPCVRGGVCPRLGMAYPDICPAGDLCDEESLVAGKVCPPGKICLAGTMTGFAFNASAPALGPVNETFLRLAPDACPEGAALPSSGAPPSAWAYAGPAPLPCNGTAVTAASLDYIRQVPFGYPRVCPPGFFCQAGTGSATTVPYDYFTPQPCFGGASCTPGSDNPLGAGLCPAGFYCRSKADGSLEERRCEPGYFCPSQGLTEPTACGEGSYQDEYEAKGCKSCPLRFFCPRTAMAEPLLTQPGYYSPGVGTVDQRPCSAGSYSATDGSSACTSCPLGTYATGYNNTNCTEAPPGTFVSYEGAAEPTACNPGTYSDVPGLTACKLCGLGSYAEGLRNTECKPAPAGAFINFEGAARPTLCNPGTYQPANGSETCVPCKPGYYTPDFGEFACKPADPGHVVPASGSTAQQQCPAGSYMPYTNASACLQCKPGTYCPKEGLTAVTPADPGFFVASPSSIAQLPCRKGSYQPDPGGAECLACANGFICPFDQMTRPLAAPAGAFSTGEGNTFASKCAPGNYSAMPGQPFCLRCPAGFQCLAEGTVEPKPCQPGFFRPMDEGGTTTISCIPCPEGTYSEAAGATDISACTPCPAGLVCAISGTPDVSRASKCADGYVCGTGTSGSSQFEEKCPAGFFCGAGTSPATKFLNPCEAGYYCFEQSTPSTAKQLRCPEDRFCLRGTAAVNNETTGRVDFYWALAKAPYELLSADSQAYLQAQIAASRARSGSAAAAAAETIAATIGAALAGSGSRRRLLSAASIFEGPPSASANRGPRPRPAAPGPRPDRGARGPAGNATLPRVWSEGAPPRRGLLQNGTTPAASNGTAGAASASSASSGATPLSFEFQALEVPAGLKCPDGSASIDQCYSTGDLQRTIDPCRAELPEGVPAQWRPYAIQPNARKGNATFFAPATEAGYGLVSIFFDFPRLAANALRAAPGAPPLNFTKGDFGVKFVSRVPSPEPPPADGTPPAFKRGAAAAGKNGSLGEPLPFMLARTDGRAVDPFTVLQVNLLPMSDATPAFFVDLELYNPANLVGFDTLASQPVVSVLFKRPERAELGTNRAFVAVLNSKTQRNDFVSPTNLQSLVFLPNRNEPSTWFDLVKWNQTDAQHPFLLTVASTDYGPIDYTNVDPSGRNVPAPTDADGKPLTFVMPYLPYVSNCAGFGRFLPLFAILEDSKGCNLTAREETVPTQQYNPFGPPPKGDACDYELKCVYEEELAATDGQSAVYWFEPTDGKKLFQIPWTPVLPADVSSADKFWSGLQSSGQFAEVETMTEGDGTASLWSGSGSKLAARRVTFELQYFQTSATSKRVVQAFVTLGDFEPVSTHDGEYTLTVKLKPMTWFELLNAFALGLEVYAIIGGIVTVTCLVIVFFFFYFHRWYWHKFDRMKSKLPPFRGWSYLRTTHPAVLMGTSAGAIPMGLVLVFCTLYIKVLKPFERQVGRWQDWGSDTALSEEQREVNQAARFGTALFACSLYFLWSAVCVLQPDANYHNRNDPYQKKQSDRLGSHNLNRGLFMAACFCLVGLMTCLMEWSYSTWFSQNIWLSVILLRIGAIVLEATLETSLRQSLLASPMLVAYDMVNFMCTIAAENFVAFLASFYFDLALKIADIVYLGSRAVWLMNNGPRIARMKTTRFLLRHTITNSPMWRFTAWLRHVALPKVEKGEAAKEEEEEKERAEDEEDALEAVVDTAGNYSVDATSSVLSPVLLIIFYIFDNEFKFQDVYNFSKLAPLYYLVFVLMVMGMQPIVDVVLLQVVELHLKVKIYEYFKHQAREYRRRRHWWKALDKEQEDETVPMTYRSIHSWAFSSQYYAVVALAASALIGLVFSVECWLRQSFDPLEDPMLALIVGGSLLGCKVIKIACEAAAFAVNFWNCRKRFTLSRGQLERLRAMGKLGRGGSRAFDRSDSRSTTTGFTGLSGGKGSGSGQGVRREGSVISSFTAQRKGAPGRPPLGSASVIGSGTAVHRKGSELSGSGVLRGNARFEQGLKAASAPALAAAPNALRDATSRGAHWAALLRNRLVEPPPAPARAGAALRPSGKRGADPEGTTSRPAPAAPAPLRLAARPGAPRPLGPARARAGAERRGGVRGAEAAGAAAGPQLRRGGEPLGLGVAPAPPLRLGERQPRQPLRLRDRLRLELRLGLGLGLGLGQRQQRQRQQPLGSRGSASTGSSRTGRSGAGASGSGSRARTGGGSSDEEDATTTHGSAPPAAPDWRAPVAPRGAPRAGSASSEGATSGGSRSASRTRSSASASASSDGGTRSRSGSSGARPRLTLRLAPRYDIVLV
eukprot:tig00020556_g11055.t1